MELTMKFKSQINKLNNFMLKHTSSNQKLINIAIKDLIKSGGKRLRPILTILTAKYGNFEEKKILKIASALELLHMATLVHDDIIDNAKIRRGEITTQKKLGKNIAVFIGDYLLSSSLGLFFNHLSQHSLQRLNKIVKLICEGEVKQYQGKYNLNLSVTDYIRRIRRKTALLFGLSTYIGAYESEIRGNTLHQFYNFGLELGMAFQIQDDILDFTGEQKKIGKKVGQDLATGIYTIPIIYLLKNRTHSDTAINILKKDELTTDDIEKITRMVKSTSVLDKSKKLSQNFLNKAQQHLNQLPTSKTKENFKFILDYQLKREK